MNSLQREVVQETCKCVLVNGAHIMTWDVGAACAPCGRIRLRCIKKASGRGHISSGIESIWRDGAANTTRTEMMNLNRLRSSWVSSNMNHFP